MIEATTPASTLCRGLPSRPKAEVKNIATKKKKSKAREEALTTLREWVKPGDKLHTIVTHVARSGMSRSIKVFRTYVEEGTPHIHEISYLVASALDYPIDQKNGGVRLGGCGMDMGFHLVYNLSRRLFPDGGPLDCTSEIRRYQAERSGEDKEIDGGYLIKHEWL